MKIRHLPGVTIDYSLPGFALGKSNSKRARGFRRIAILTRLAQMLLPEEPDEVEVPAEDLVRALMALSNSRTSEVGRAAACAILDLYYSDWRDFIFVNPEHRGPAVFRESVELSRWAKAVKARDGYACVECGSKKKLDAHHILSFSRYPHARVILDNGITLCKSCHLKAHNGSWRNA